MQIVCTSISLRLSCFFQDCVPYASMTPPSSPYFQIGDIHNAGRGVITTSSIPAGTVLLTSDPPAAHVVIKPYRKEVCANCFAYDRGRTLPVRDILTGKVFCSTYCQDEWRHEQGEIGVEAWLALHAFVQTRSKGSSNEVLSFTDPRPRTEEIEAAWLAAKKQVAIVREQKNQKNRKVSNQQHTNVEVDHMGFFLSGILQRHRSPRQWNDEMCSLAMDGQPYTSTGDLLTHCNSFVQLMSILPEALVSEDESDICQTMVSAGSHNAFGIRSGGEDLEEYMGYAIYPSASYFNHSCEPNIKKRRVGSFWEFSAARTLSEGEQCCITYLGGDEKDLDLDSRRTRLESVWGFRCMCTRCVREDG
nr:putative protein lysine methyltransferase set6 [Quercus suber]